VRRRWSLGCLDRCAPPAPAPSTPAPGRERGRGPRAPRPWNGARAPSPPGTAPRDTLPPAPRCWRGRAWLGPTARVPRGATPRAPPPPAAGRGAASPRGRCHTALQPREVPQAAHPAPPAGAACGAHEVSPAPQAMEAGQPWGPRQKGPDGRRRVEALVLRPPGLQRAARPRQRWGGWPQGAPLRWPRMRRLKAGRPWGALPAWPRRIVAAWLVWEDGAHHALPLPPAPRCRESEGGHGRLLGSTGQVSRHCSSGGLIAAKWPAR
jgi:hypothetical protein